MRSRRFEKVHVGAMLFVVILALIGAFAGEARADSLNVRNSSATSIQVNATPSAGLTCRSTAPKALTLLPRREGTIDFGPCTVSAVSLSNQNSTSRGLIDCQLIYSSAPQQPSIENHYTSPVLRSVFSWTNLGDAQLTNTETLSLTCVDRPSR